MSDSLTEYQAGITPTDYVCSKCDSRGVKLWRQYQTFANRIDLFCVACALLDQNKDYNMQEDGRHLSSVGDLTDQIGWMVPAVPTEDGTYWGYTSVPSAGVVWWKELPLKVEQE